MPSPHYILDTDSVTYQQIGRPTIVQRLAQVDPATVATTIVTLYEQLRGRLAAINRQQDDHSLQAAYRRLQETHGLLPYSRVAIRLRRGGSLSSAHQAGYTH